MAKVDLRVTPLPERIRGSEERAERVTNKLHWRSAGVGNRLQELCVDRDQTLECRESRNNNCDLQTFGNLGTDNLLRSLDQEGKKEPKSWIYIVNDRGSLQ